MMSEIRCILEDGNVDAFLVANQILFPEGLELSRNEAEITMHLARTGSNQIDKQHRLYSHRWLIDRGLPSQLPQSMRKIVAESKIVEAVGVAVMTQNPDLEPAAKAIERAMADAVEDCYANGDIRLELIQARIEVARQEATRQMFGR